MKLNRVSVRKYRSIDTVADFEVGDFTVLIGPNNQGKSNLLRAAVLAMEVIEGWSRLPPVCTLGKRFRWSEFFEVGIELARVGAAAEMSGTTGSRTFHSLRGIVRGASEAP